MDELVRPDAPITDYVTRYSGITAAMMADVTTSLADVQARSFCVRRQPIHTADPEPYPNPKKNPYPNPRRTGSNTRVSACKILVADSHLKSYRTLLSAHARVQACCSITRPFTAGPCPHRIEAEEACVQTGVQVFACASCAVATP